MKLKSESSSLYCKHNVELFQPTANGAIIAKKKFLTERFRKCYAVIGMTGVDSDENNWLTCPFDNDPVPGTSIKQKSKLNLHYELFYSYNESDN